MTEKLGMLQEAVQNPPECSTERAVVEEHWQDIATRLEAASVQLCTLLEQHANVSELLFPPPTPQNLTVSGGDSTDGSCYAVVSFSEVPEAQHYIVRYRRRDAVGTQSEVMSPISEAIVTGLQAGITYRFSVLAVHSRSGESAESALVDCTLLCRPGPPRRVSVVGSKANLAVVRFRPPEGAIFDEGANAVREYTVRWSAVPAGLRDSSELRLSDLGREADVVEVTDSRSPIMVELPTVGRYRFVVLARNDAGLGMESEAVFLEVPPQQNRTGGSFLKCSSAEEDDGCFGSFPI